MSFSLKTAITTAVAVGFLLFSGLSWGQSPAPDFETFVVPLPATAQRAAPEAGLGMSPARSLVGAGTPQDTVHANIALTLFPGQRDLSADLDGRVSGQILSSQISLERWLQGGWQNAGYLETSRSGGGVHLGTASSDLLGNVEGFRLFSSSPHPGQASVGVGLYQRLGQSGARGTLALDSRWQVSPAGQLGMLVAADSSWRLTQQYQGRRWNLSSFLGRDAQTGHLEEGLFWEARPLPSLSVYSRVSTWTGVQPGRNAAVGLTHWIGPAFVGMDYSRLTLGDDRLQTLAATLFLPLRRDTFSLRWQRGLNDSASGVGLDHQQSQSWLATFAAPVNPQTTFWVNGGVLRQSGPDAEASATQSILTLGVQKTINALWDVQAEATRRLDTALLQGRLTLGYRLTPAQQIKLLFGPTTDYSSSGQVRHAFGLEFIQGFDVKSRPSGTISGQVLLDGAPCPTPLVIQVDQDRTVKTDRSGQFRLSGVSVGQHQVAIRLAALPIDLSSVSPSCTVEVKARETSRLSFAVRRVGWVQGIVHVDPDAFGQTDCTAGIGVTITAGGDAATTTQADNTFLLGNVPVGKRQLALVTSTIPPDFQIVGPDHFDLNIDPNQPSRPLEFRIAPRPRQISFNDTAAPLNPPSVAALPTPINAVKPSVASQVTRQHLRSSVLASSFLPIAPHF